MVDQEQLLAFSIPGYLPVPDGDVDSDDRATFLRIMDNPGALTYLFSGPTERRPFARPLERWGYDRGRTVYRLNDEWVETSDPYWATIRDADLVAHEDRPGGERTDGTDRDRLLFLGGRVYEVSSAVAAVLTDAGYGGNLS